MTPEAPTNIRARFEKRVNLFRWVWYWLTGRAPEWIVQFQGKPRQVEPPIEYTVEIWRGNERY